jgi:DNA-binding CsgD family transcriptional regulator
MTNPYDFTKREMEIIELLLQGKSNKQIALALQREEGTIEFHLTSIYTKLNVHSRVEAILLLNKPGKPLENAEDDGTGETLPASQEESEFSLVEPINKKTYIEIDPTMSTKKPPNIVRRTGQLIGSHKMLTVIGILAVLALMVVLYSTVQGSQKKYERECETPDAYTVGQTIGRSNASSSSVHGQFGTTSSTPWSAQPGSVTYKNISLPQVEHLYIQVCYSKHSSSSVPILIYLDDETDQRAAFYPKDQGDWNRFAWTELIYLRRVESGVHTIRFVTAGQQYGVADLDKFVLIAGKSP